MERLLFISQESSSMTQLDSIRKACEAGVKWVQLRVKDQPAEEVLEIAQAAKEVCESFGVWLSINDYPDIARAVNAYGVHVGKKDMPLSQARIVIGTRLLGGTANTFEDLCRHTQVKADYVGVGPFRFTTTKKNLSPVLGLQGYRQLMTKCRETGNNIPVFAIGGIQLEDVEELMRTGVYGIAVSSLISLSPDPEKVVEKINQILLKYEYGNAFDC